MRKSHFLIIILMMLILSGCSSQTNKKTTTNQVKAATHKVINAPTKTWTFKQEVNSDQTKRHGVSKKINPSTETKENILRSWTTDNGQFTSAPIQYKQTSLTKWKQNFQKNYQPSYRKHIHYMKVKQINATLKKLGSDIKIDQLSDLIFLKASSGTLPLNQAFVAKGNKLYALTIEYYDTDQTITISRGQSFVNTNTKKSVEHVDTKQINGTWVAPETKTSANDSGKIMVKDGFLYQRRYDSIERSAVQDLSTYSTAELNQNTTYNTQKSEASRAGYQLNQKSIASGDSIGYLYIFVNSNKLVRIGQGQTTSYDKTNDSVSDSDLSPDYLKIFNDNNSKEADVSILTVKSDEPVIDMSSSINYLTDPYAGQIVQ